jgi:hypothetical protein
MLAKRSSLHPSAAARRDASLRSLLNDAKPSTSRGEIPALSQALTIAFSASLNSGSGAPPRL